VEHQHGTWLTSKASEFGGISPQVNLHVGFNSRAHCSNSKPTALFKRSVSIPSHVAGQELLPRRDRGPKFLKTAHLPSTSIGSEETTGYITRTTNKRNYGQQQLLQLALLRGTPLAVTAASPLAPKRAAYRATLSSSVNSYNSAQIHSGEDFGKQ